MHAPMRYLLTTDPGLEDLVADELAERVPDATPGPPGAGRLLVEAVTTGSLLQLRTVHDVIEVRAEGRVDDLDDIGEVTAAARIPELAEAPSFRVTASGSRVAEFRSGEIARAAGAVLFRRHRTPVNLERPDLDIRVDVVDRRCVVGLPCNTAPLSKRIRRSRALRSALMPTIAAGMLRMVGAHRGGGALIDPMCGAGTIPIEAVACNAGLDVSAADWDEETTRVARATLVNHALDLPVTRLDARELGTLHPGAFDFIVTDPPYGVRQGTRTPLSRLYAGLLASFREALRPGGRLAIVVVKHRTFAGAAEAGGWSVQQRRAVASGGLDLHVFVLSHEPGEFAASPASTYRT